MTLPEIFERFTGLKVLIVGDVMLDAYIYGTVKRISPEAPVPVVNVSRRERRLGGAANVALNIQSLGATPILCSVIGDDADGMAFESLLQERGITSRGIIKSAHRVTTVKHRVLSASQHLLRIDSEMDAPLTALDQKTLIDHIRQLVREVDLVIFEDYDKGCLDEEVIRAAIAAAKERGIPTAVDPKKRNFLSYQGCTLFKPNLKELKEGLGVEFEVTNRDQLTAAVHYLSELLHFDQALITLSEHGVYFYSKNEQKGYPAHLRSIADVSGAGDTVISIAGLCLALGLPLTFLAELANLGGGIVCEYQGVVPINRERLLQEALADPILNPGKAQI